MTIDQELYVPRSWITDAARCRLAGIPEQVGCATKPAPAVRMINRTLDAGADAAWVAADEVYGGSPPLRGALEERQFGYVLAGACDRQIATRAGKRCYSAAPLPLATLVRVAGRRRTVEETFQVAKGLTELDEHQVGRWTS